MGIRPGEGQCGHQYVRFFSLFCDYLTVPFLQVNYLMIESLQKYDFFFGDSVRIRKPLSTLADTLTACLALQLTMDHQRVDTYEATACTMWDIAHDISKRLIRLFKVPKDPQTEQHLRAVHPETGELQIVPGRPSNGMDTLFARHPLLKDKVLFYEYFNGDNGAGLGASHQTGWTALVAKLLQQVASA